MPFAIQIVAIIVLGFTGLWLAWWSGLPAILVLLVMGFLAGPISGLVNPDQLFGSAFSQLVSIAVSIILFEGSLGLRVADIPRQRKLIAALVTLGALTTWLLASAAAYLLLDLSAPPAVLLGAILVVSGPTVVIPLLIEVRPRAPLGSILRWEAILIDSVGAILALLVLEVLLSKQEQVAPMAILLRLTELSLVAVVLAGAGWALVSYSLRRYLVPDQLQAAFVLASSLLVFGLSNHAAHESGYLAVTIMGVALANTDRLLLERAIEFKETLRDMLIGGLFILLSARARLDELSHVNLGLIAFLAVLIFIIRPAAVLLATCRSELRLKEKILLAAVAPRGIVAAAVASVFSVALKEAGVRGAELLLPYTFLTILGTVLFYGGISRPAARLLGLVQESPQGLLLVGANSLARAIAHAVQGEGFPVVLVDRNAAQVAAAHRQGLDARHANVLSPGLVEEIDLELLGRLLAMTSSDEANALAVMHFSKLLGVDNVYQLSPWQLSPSPSISEQARSLDSRLLFGGLSYENLSKKLTDGWQVMRRKLDSSFDLTAWSTEHKEYFVPLFVSARGRLIVLTAATLPLSHHEGAILALCAPSVAAQPWTPISLGRPFPAAA